MQETPIFVTTVSLSSNYGQVATVWRKSVISDLDIFSSSKVRDFRPSATKTPAWTFGRSLSLGQRVRWPKLKTTFLSAWIEDARTFQHHITGKYDPLNTSKYNK